MKGRKNAKINTIKKSINCLVNKKGLLYKLRKYNNLNIDEQKFNCLDINF